MYLKLPRGFRNTSIVMFGKIMQRFYRKTNTDLLEKSEMRSKIYVLTTMIDWLNGYRLGNVVKN